MANLDQFHWWQRAVLYQVYVRSFFDTNGDGIGDLPGVIAKLDYLRALGATAIWLSPVYRSPQVDFGYDVAHYYEIDPCYGTSADFDRLIAEAHRRGLKLLMDFVPNHTSCEHPWFLDARRSRQSAHRDWYLWCDPAPGGGPPNNWLSRQNGSAWEFDDTTGQYYLHTYFPQQPDLNWRNPQVRLAMLDVLRYWLDRGVDGFRIDAVAHLIKDRRWRDNPPNPDFQPSDPPTRRQLLCYMHDQPEVHDVIGWLRRLVDLYGDRILIGETYLAPGRLLSYYGPEGLNFPFNFELIETAWTAGKLRALIDRYEAMLAPDDWPSWVLGNHDRSRVATRIGDEKLRLAAMLLLTLRGTPTMYYGDEIGMHNAELPPDETQDPRAETMPGFGRDPQRTPLPWDRGHAAGFTSGRPWLPLAEDYETRNVARQTDDPDSLLQFYCRLLELRSREPALQIGDYAPVPSHDDVLAYVRSFERKQFLIAMNFCGHRRSLKLPIPATEGRLRLTTATIPAAAPDGPNIELGPWEGKLIAIEKSEAVAKKSQPAG